MSLVFRIWMQLLLLLGCMVIVAVAVIVLPGLGDSSQFNGVQTSLAFGLAHVGAMELTTNVVLSALSTVQALVVTTCVSVFLRHLLRVWLGSTSNKVTFAALDVVLQQDYWQMLRQIHSFPNTQVLLLGFLSIIMLVLVKAGDVLVQTMVDNGSGLLMGANSYTFPDTSFVSTTLMNSVGNATVASDVLFQYFSEAMINVGTDCDNGFCSPVTDGASPLINCANNDTISCVASIPVYTDYHMDCSSTVVSATALLSADITVPFVNATMDSSFFDEFTEVPKISWNMSTPLPNNHLILTDCIIFAASTQRVENSSFGTTSRKEGFVYNQLDPSNTYLVNQTTQFPASFQRQPSCYNLPAPICMLYMTGNVLNAPWGTGAMDGFASWGLNMLTIPIRRNVNTRTPQQLASDLEVYMRYFYEDLSKRMILHGQSPMVAATCSDCAIARTRVVNKSAVVLFFGCVCGIGGALMLASILLTVTTKVEYKPFNAIEFAQLPVQSDRVLGVVANSLEGDENAQFTKSISATVEEKRAASTTLKRLSLSGMRHQQQQPQPSSAVSLNPSVSRSPLNYEYESVRSSD